MVSFTKFALALCVVAAAPAAANVVTGAMNGDACTVDGDCASNSCGTGLMGSFCCPPCGTGEACSPGLPTCVAEGTAGTMCPNGEDDCIQGSTTCWGGQCAACDPCPSGNNPVIIGQGGSDAARGAAFAVLAGLAATAVAMWISVLL